MREHHRNYPYRPPRRPSRKAPRELYLRFLRDYLYPHWPKLLAAFLLIGANACSPYLLAYYGRIVVDHILVVEPVRPARQTQVEEWIWPGQRQSLAAGRRTVGLFRSLDRQPMSSRSPEAGRYLFIFFLIYLSSVLMLNGAERMAQKKSILLSRGVAAALREDMHQKVLDLSLRFHQTTTPGRLLARITSDIEVIQTQTMQTILLASRSLLMLVVGFLILFMADWRIGLAFLTIAPAYALAHFHFRTNIKQFNRELRHTNSCLYGLVTQKMEGIKVIQAYAREGLERLYMHRLSACFLRDAVSQQGKAAGLQAWGRIISGIASSGIFLFAVRMVIGGDMTLGEMLFIHGTVANLFMPVMQLTQLSITIGNMQVTLGRMMDVLETEPEIKEAPDAVPLPSPLASGISIHNLGFSYRGSDTSDPALRSIKLHIPAGSWLCLMGASGTGKSTLMYLLARLYRPDHGHILIDDVPLSKITMASLRERIGFVPQTPQIFSGTIRDNITYGKPDASPAEIMAAARMAEMHDFILQMPVQYETIIGERGSSLSGGQRQRLALARALLNNPEILLLDDCTSALDADTEGKIQMTLAENLRGKTAIIASQRVSMASRCDRIAVLENGVVSEYGTHDELIRYGGFYTRLNAQQTE